MIATKAPGLSVPSIEPTSPAAASFKSVLPKPPASQPPPAAHPLTGENVPPPVQRDPVPSSVASAVEGIQEAQRRLDQVMSLSASGKSFSPAELLAFQAKVYQCSQQIDLAGKVVDKAGGGIRQILQTQL